MKPLDLLEQFDKGAGAFGFIATYEFDPQFFERRILAKRTFGSADRLVVFMDRGRYQELINGGLQVSGFNRRYLVAPMDRAPEVFHPKLYLALGDKGAHGLIGSNNCTNAGIAYNVELCSTFSFLSDKPGPDDAVARSVLRQIYDAMKVFAADAGALKDVIETEFLKRAEDRFPWLHPRVTIPKTAVELIHSHESALLDGLIKRLKGRTVRKITIIAPFYDKELRLLKQLHELWPAAALTVVAQQDYATLAGKKLAELFVGGKHRCFAASPQPGRRLHAKAFAFETDAGTFWLSGSPNATLAAFDGRNTEAALWLSTKEKPEDLLDGSGLGLEKIDPAKFKAGAEQESRNEKRATGEIVLGSAVLVESGLLECELEVPAAVRDLTLRVRNINETLPVFSNPIRRVIQGKASVELDENQIAQIRSTAICELKGSLKNGQESVSNPVALVQLHQLLRESRPYRGGRDRLREIEETGENLVTYVDSLGSIRDAVEFYNNTSIRFFDGESQSHGTRRDIWKPRDPFKPDTPPNWLNAPVGGSNDDLRAAILDFVERHQRQKLYKHVKRGNLNGLPNFLDIFRTLNGLLFAYHTRVIGGAEAVIPFGFVTTHVMTNLELLVGPFEPNEDADYEGNGFIAAIQKNMKGDQAAVLERLRDERVPQMLRAAAEAMINVRTKARNMVAADLWAMSRLRWVSEWIKSHGLDEPTAEDIRAAGLEYLPEQNAA
jgi:hypothetical protein